jgi:hypothetical protein
MRNVRKYVTGMACISETFRPGCVKILNLVQMFKGETPNAFFLIFSRQQNCKINFRLGFLPPRKHRIDFTLSVSVSCENQNRCLRENISHFRHKYHLSDVNYDTRTSHVRTRFGRGFAVVHIVTSEWHNRKLCCACLSPFRHATFFTCPRYKSE